MILWLIGHTTFAKPHLRHTTGIWGVELAGGKAALGYCARGAYAAYINPHCYWKIALEGTCYQHTPRSYQAFQLTPALGVTLFEHSSTFYCNLLLGTAATYESHQQRRDACKGYNLAIRLGPELELLLSHHLALIASLLPSYYCLQNPYGHWGYQGTVGIKLTF